MGGGGGEGYVVSYRLRLKRPCHFILFYLLLSLFFIIKKLAIHSKIMFSFFSVVYNAIVGNNLIKMKNYTERKITISHSHLIV